MKHIFRIALTVAAILHSGSALAAESPVYLVAQVQITDQTRYSESYAAKVGPMLVEAGAELLAATPEREQLEGDWVGNWTVVVRFPSKAKALEWYRSDAYQAVRPERLRSSSEGNIVLLPSFAPPQ